MEYDNANASFLLNSRPHCFKFSFKIVDGTSREVALPDESKASHFPLVVSGKTATVMVLTFLVPTHVLVHIILSVVRQHKSK